VLIIITVIKGKTETLCQLSSRVENLFRNDTSADYRNWTVNGTPTRFAPLALEISVVFGPHRSTSRATSMPPVHSPRSHRSPSVRSDLTSHKTPKNLCERDALPAELYPRNL